MAREVLALGVDLPGAGLANGLGISPAATAPCPDAEGAATAPRLTVRASLGTLLVVGHIVRTRVSRGTPVPAATSDVAGPDPA